MPFKLEIPIFTTDVEEHDVRSFEQMSFKELLKLCKNFNSAECRRIRLELNAVGSYGDGGLTPNIKDAIRFLTHLRKSEILTEDQQPAIRIMIRPRGAKNDDKSVSPMTEVQDFQYSEAELLAMCQSIEDFKTMGRDVLSPERGDGFVFGVQKRLDGPLNELMLHPKANKRLTSTAHPYPCFLHRAFDGVLATSQNYPGTKIPIGRLVEKMKGHGFKGVLTSGGWGNATNNLETLGELGRAALKEKEEDKFELIVGGGVRYGNVWDICYAMKELAQHRDFWLHSSCLTGEASPHTEARTILMRLNAAEEAAKNWTMACGAY
ncbi:copper homeostasis CutC domain-containing protein [Neurospora hispaniola]|uniref:Copper homeostasis protein cutC homolog n=1 Tax=Neurospora hispaniola TaxID=588809 RepID=A0AAJ0MVX2_9PEZI|nr:copper homeostasis CutC domain-containing protein [Neurospora hispaniola]